MQFPEPTITQEFLSGFAEVWWLWVPLLLLLIVMGWFTRRWCGGKLLLLSLVIIVTFAATVTLRERAKERATLTAWNNLRSPLPQASKIDGFQLAAGTMVRWDNERPGHLLTAELGTGQEVSPGIVLTGEGDNRWGDFWRGTLSKDSVLRGWKCAAGKIDIHTSGELRWCVLAAKQPTASGVVPAGTAILLEPGDPSDALLHLPDVGMRANPGNYWIPPHEWFLLYSDGELESLPGPITLRGVTFDPDVVLRYGDEDVTRWYGYSVPTPPTIAHPTGPLTGWRGDITSPLNCESGHKVDKGSRVTIPVSGDTVTSVHWDSSSPQAKLILDSFHCDLGPA